MHAPAVCICCARRVPIATLFLLQRAAPVVLFISPDTRRPRPAQIVKTLDLDPPQRGAMVSLWTSFEARMARVLGARVSLHQRISGTMPNGYMGRDFAVNFFKAHEAMDALKSNLRQEHIIIYDYLSNFHQVGTPAPPCLCVVSDMQALRFM